MAVMIEEVVQGVIDNLAKSIRLEEGERTDNEGWAVVVVVVVLGEQLVQVQILFMDHDQTAQ